MFQICLFKAFMCAKCIHSMNRKVWWAASGPMHGIYRTAEGATQQLHQFNKPQTKPIAALNCETAVEQLILANKIPEDAERIYTDGSFQSGVGAWAVYNETTQKVATGSFQCRSSTEAEIQALVMALKSIEQRRKQSFIIFTDERSCCSRAWHLLASENMKLKAQKKISSLENLETAIEKLKSTMSLYFVLVPSMGIIGNRMADMIAYNTWTAHSKVIQAQNSVEGMKKATAKATAKATTKATTKAKPKTTIQSPAEILQSFSLFQHMLLQ